MSYLIFIGIFIVVPVIFVIAIYNSLVTLRNQCNEAWSNIDTELQRRYHLIPNLVNTVKGYASHERKLLEQITKMPSWMRDG